MEKPVFELVVWSLLRPVLGSQICPGDSHCVHAQGAARCMPQAIELAKLLWPERPQGISTGILPNGRVTKLPFENDVSAHSLAQLSGLTREALGTRN